MITKEERLYSIADISICTILHTRADRRDLIDIYNDLQDFYHSSELLKDTYYILPEQLEKAVDLGVMTREQQSALKKRLLFDCYTDQDLTEMLIKVNPVTDSIDIVSRYAWIEDYGRKIVDAIVDGCKFSNALLTYYCRD